MDAIMKKYINNHQYKDDEDEYGVYEDTNDAGIYFSNIYHNSALKSLADNKIEERLDKYFEYSVTPTLPTKPAPKLLSSPILDIKTDNNFIRKHRMLTLRHNEETEYKRRVISGKSTEHAPEINIEPTLKTHIVQLIKYIFNKIKEMIR